MASVLEILLKGEVSPSTVVYWLRNTNNVGVPDNLADLENLKQEFIPFFLNFLRDQTIHLIQSSKSATPSPAKTPSLKKLQKSVKRKKDTGKRQQLFGASPAGDVDDLRNLPSSVFSPNTSLDSPSGTNQRPERSNSKGNLRNYASQKGSPQCGSQRSPYIQQTPEQQRSKQKFSLGEFIATPDQSNTNGWKKKSPHSGGRRELSTDNTPSPVFGQNRKSGGRRKHSSSPLVHSNYSSKQTQEYSSPPVFSLTSSNDFPPMDNGQPSLNDFPPMDNQGDNTNAFLSRNPNRRSLDLDSKSSTNDCDTKTSRVINFSNPDSNAVSNLTRDKLQEIRRISPITITSKIPPGPRRITPTIIKADNSLPQNSAFLVPIEEHENTSKSTDFKPKAEQFPSNGEMSINLLEEHELLKQERCRRQSQTSESSNLSYVHTPTKPSLEQSTSLIETVEARMAEVSHQDKLDALVSLYSKCLDENLLPNLIVELYFLVQLLTARGGGDGPEDTFIYGEDVIEENYFSSVHNTVYFAVCIFEQQKRLLSILDRGTLRLLFENQRIAAFSVSLQKHLEKLYEKADIQRGPAFPKSPIGSVSFQADTDNSKNFPNIRSFHLFKKQRDGFYELIRLWEASHMNPNYNMEEMFGARVKTLVNFKTDLANHIHFARLFQSQLIAMCKGDGSIRANDDDENITLLSQLKRTNPEKFKKLQERFIKPLSVGGPCPAPSFSGIQEFFRDFIIVACNPLLNQHLCDTFAAKVLELNETSFNTSEDDDATTANGDEEEKEMFCSVFQSLRLVGKFLGFVTFLPYQSPDRMPDTMETTYLSIRNKQQPPIDLLECLYSSFLSGTLSLTVPWVVEFLSMMDTMAPKLDHLQMVLLLLLYIHKYVWVQLQDDLCYSSLIVVSLISWLMENPVIPDGLFFSEIPDDIVNKVKGLLPSLGSLDNRNFVDQSLFYTCYPYIGEMKALLVEFAVGSSSKISAIRKITPVSAEVPSQKSLTDRQLQLQMEENFFHNHPASMKRVVDFVADRSASNFIKKFRGSLLQESLTQGKDRVIKQMLTIAEGSPSSKLKDKVSQVTSRIAQDMYTKVRASVTKDAPVYCRERIPTLMTMLLPDDNSPVMINMAAAISERLAEEKVLHWMNRHITIAMYQTEVMPDLDKLTRSITQTVQEVPSHVSKPEVNGADHGGVVMATIHDVTLPHPSEVLIDLKDCIKNVALRKRSLTMEKVLQLLDSTKQNLENRQDILPAVHKAFVQLTMEIVISLLIHAPSLYTKEVVDRCIHLWKHCLRDTSLALIFSGRVVQMLQNTDQPKSVWELYTDLLVTLYHSEVIQPSGVQENCLKFLPYIHDECTVIMTCECLCKFATAIPECDRASNLGECLQMLYNMLPSNHSQLAARILDILGVTNNNNIDLHEHIDQMKVG